MYGMLRYQKHVWTVEVSQTHGHMHGLYCSCTRADQVHGGSSQRLGEFQGFGAGERPSACLFAQEYADVHVCMGRRARVYG